MALFSSSLLSAGRKEGSESCSILAAVADCFFDFVDGIEDEEEVDEECCWCLGCSLVELFVSIRELVSLFLSLFFLVMGRSMSLMDDLSLVASVWVGPGSGSTTAVVVMM